MVGKTRLIGSAPIAINPTMKTIPNKLTDIPLREPGSFATFATLIRDSLDYPPSTGGFTPAVMRARARVDSAVAKVEPGGEIIFEDADYETAKSALQSCAWRLRSPYLIELFGLFGL